jgi:5-amino-6-(5-phospho-D-ribitylamino)uracil phosphatase
MNLLLSRFIEKDTVIKVIDYIYNNYEGGVSLSEVNSKISILPKKGISLEKDFKKAIEYKDIDEIGQVYQIHKRFENEDYTKVLENDLNSGFKSSITAYANSHNVDIVANGVNKSSAIKYLNEHLSDIDEIITIGDSYNDLQMILDYDGYIVFSGKESLKKMVKNICANVSECLSIISNVK